jgi:hypothetical protein
MNLNRKKAGIYIIDRSYKKYFYLSLEENNKFKNRKKKKIIKDANKNINNERC